MSSGGVCSDIDDVIFLHLFESMSYDADCGVENET